MRSLILAALGFVCGVNGALLVRQLCCRHPFCFRRATHWVAYYWPPVLGIVNFGGGHKKEMQGREPSPSRRGPFCFTHATRECAHWTAEFGTHDWPVRAPLVAVEDKL